MREVLDIPRRRSSPLSSRRWLRARSGGAGGGLMVVVVAVVGGLAWHDAPDIGRGT
jgi:hypothetical protein